MKLFILLLILSTFVQTSFLPINLCLVLIIARSALVQDQVNLISSFISGILLGILGSQNIGFWPLLFLLIIKALSFIKKLPFTSNALTIIPISFILFTLTAFLESQFFAQSIDLKKIVIEAILTLPAYFLIKNWEERFVVKSDIKLKINK